MGKITEYYKYIDEDGDEVTFNYEYNSCMCLGGSCVDDHLRLTEACDVYDTVITGNESKWLIQDLIQIGVDSGRLIKFKE